LVAAVAVAADWPQWLGPTRDAVSPEKVAPWKTAPKVVWKQAVGEGHSSPVVAGGRVFIHAKVKDKDEEEVVALDAKSGDVLWRTPYPRGNFKSLFGNGPRSTPAVSDDRVYTLGITGILSCFEAGSGKQLWQVDTLKKFEAKNLGFGVSTSPLIDGKRLLVNVGGKGASVVAFDKGTGEVLWKSGDDPASYSSPILVGDGSQRQAVFLTQQNLLSLNPADGSVWWSFPLKDELLESSTTPVRVGDLLVASTITSGGTALRLENAGDRPAFKQAWKNDALTC